MNADLFGHFLDHHRPQRFDPLIQKILLPAHNYFAGPQNRALALRNIAHQLHGGAEPLLDVILDFFLSAFGHQHAAVARAQAQAGQVFFVHGDDPLAATLGKNHVGFDQPRLFAVVKPARPRVERANELHASMRFFRGHVQRLAKDLSDPVSAAVADGSDNQCRHFHGAPAFFDLCLGFGFQARDADLLAIRSCAIELCSTPLLRLNLEQQALAQIAVHATPAGSRCCTRSIAAAKI